MKKLPRPKSRYLLENRHLLQPKISERSKSTSTTFLISGFHSTFGGRTLRYSTPQSNIFIIVLIVSVAKSRPIANTKSLRICLVVYDMSSM
jgi:hypothetical protein